MFSRPDRLRSDLLLLAAFSALSQVAYLCVLPISIEGDGAGYYLAARYFSGDPHGEFSYFHPPGYALFLLATGATWLRSLYLTIVVQAVMGALAPLLVFGILRDSSRRAAIAAALLFALSGVPYTYAKAFLSEQVYMFLVLAMALGVSRFLIRQGAGYAVLVVASAVAAILLRTEALYLSLLAVIVMAIAAWPERRALWTLAASSAAAVAVVMAWSVERAAILGDPSLIGSLNNYHGHTLFYRVYITLPPEARFWHCVVSRIADPTCGNGSSFTPLVEPTNGPASRALAELVSEWAASDSRTQFPDRTPQQIFADFFAKPSEGGSFDRFGLANWLAVRFLGYIKGDELLGEVALEAVRVHPETLGMMAGSVMPYFGISFRNIAYYFKYAKIFGPFVFANWQVDGYEFAAFQRRSGPAGAVARALPRISSELANAAHAPRTSIARHWPDGAQCHTQCRRARSPPDVAGVVVGAQPPALLLSVGVLRADPRDVHGRGRLQHALRARDAAVHADDILRRRGYHYPCRRIAHEIQPWLGSAIVLDQEASPRLTRSAAPRRDACAHGSFKCLKRRRKRS